MAPKLREWKSKRPAQARSAAELALLTAIGLLMGAIAPYGTGDVPGLRRFAYWLACIVGGGAIGIACDEALARRAGGYWPRLTVSSLGMTPGVTMLVMLIGRMLLRQPLSLNRFVGLLWQVWVISALVMALRQLTWRPAHTRVRTLVVTAPPLPEAEAAFRRRLSARRRTARLIAIEAHDHYLRVHTDAGAELVTARFSEAMDELAGAHGFRTHRSWWVAADAIETVRWRRGAGEARLAGGVIAPVSRSQADALKAAGWF